MNKKLLVLSILFFSLSILNAQHLPLPTSNNTTVKSINDESAFKEKAENFEKYFTTKDVNKKGSGYKPFKRWEYHWSHYLQKDGAIAPAESLWKAWEQKQLMAKGAKADSNWSSKGPFSQSSNSGQGRINTVVVDPNNANTIYVGAPAGGLWKSTDAGVNWIPLTDDLPQIGVSGIAIDPNNSNIIYISTGDDDAGDSYSIGVLKSIDGGTTWNTTGNISGSPISSNEIIIDPSNSNIVWVATGNGLFQSINAGTTWSNKLSGNIRDFKLKLSDPNTIYAVSSNQFFTSTNGGVSFTSTSTGLPLSNTIGRLRVEVTPAAPNNVYVLAAKTNWAFDGVYISTNSGITFFKTSENSDIFGSTQAWYDLAFCVSDTNVNHIFVGVLDIWKSTNSSGDNFTKINSWFQQTPSFTHADIHFMRYYNGVLYAGTDGGVYKSTDNGTIFTDLTQNLSISQFYKISVSKQNSNSMSGGLQDNGGFSLHNNIWHNYHGGDGMDSAADPNDENTFYGFTQFGGSLNKTTDGGITSLGVTGAPSQETGPNDSGGNWVTPLVANKGGEIYAGYSQLYKLENDNWTQVSDHRFLGNLEVIEIDPNNSDNIFVARGLNIYKSTNKGKTFTTLSSSNTGVSGINVSSIEIHNTNSNIVWLTTTGTGNSQFPSSGHTGGGVYMSIDGGLTYTNITSGLPNESKFVIRHHSFSNNNSIYVGTALGVYHRNDDTNLWEVFSTNLPNVAVTDLEINPYDNTITAATYGRSVWQSAIPAVTFPAVDIDLLNVNSPQSNIVSCGGDINPVLNVTNNGQNTITAFTVNYNIDSGANQTYNWTGSIASNASALINLPTIQSLTEGDHTISTNIDLNNDENIFNNTAQNDFTLSINQTGVGQSVHIFDDAIQDKWIVSDNNLWQIGMPTTTSLNNVVASGYVTNPSGNYPDQTTSYLTSPCYNLSLLENPVLKFKMAFDLEFNWDIVYMEYSTNQGDTWQILGTANDPDWYNSNRTNASSGSANDCQNCPGAQWTGLNDPLKNYSYDLVALNSETSIMFRFKFISDFSVNEEGVVIDDFVIDATSILGVNDFEKGALSIYPNPSSDIFNIRRVNGNGEKMNIQVFDITGKLIRKIDNITDNNYPLDMTGITNGIYFMKIDINNKQLVKKLILK